MPPSTDAAPPASEPIYTPPVNAQGTAGAPDNASSPGAGPTPRLSLQSFLTDGSLARLCDEMTRLTGVPIWLRDTDGRAVVPRDGGRRWELVSPEAGAERAFSLLSRPFPGLGNPGDATALMNHLFVAPLTTSVGEIGTIAMTADWGADDPRERRALERAVLLMAATACESVEGQLSLRRRLHELDALFRLSSLLVQTQDDDALLQRTLSLVLEALGLDAGTISMFEDGPAQADAPPVGAGQAPAPAGPGATARLIHRASVGLSRAWLDDSAPLSIDGALRLRAMAGEVVCVEDLLGDERISDPERPRAERLASLMTTGLTYQGRALGLIRLYSRSRRAFSPDDCELLRAMADHAAMLVAVQGLRALREQDQQVQRQVAVAADVQRRMLPRTLPSNPRFDLASRYQPSHVLGGDFYDFFEKPGGELGMVVGDVVGKGVPAALLMSAVRASLRAFASEDWRIDEVVRKVNLAMSRDTLESEFCTLWCGVVDPASLVLSYCSAGHDPALLLRRESGPGGPWAATNLGTDGMPVGIDPAQAYEVATVQLRAGDVLVAYTDGLSEARDFDNRGFGKERIVRTLTDLLTAEPAAPAARVVERLMWALRQFCGLKMSGDDVTIAVVRVR